MMSKGPLITEGNTAEVFAWGKNHVLKLYRPGYPPSEAEREADLVQAVIKAGANTPAIVEIVTVEGRVGAVFERVDGPTMFEAMMEDGAEFAAYASLLAKLHANLHKLSSATLPKLHDRLRGKLRGGLASNEAGLPNRSALSVPIAQRILDSLVHLPNGDVLCHGDFHPQNVLMTDDGPVIIDWVDTTCGNPAADVARTIVLFKYALLPPQLGAAMIQRIEQARHLFIERYLTEYTALNALAPHEVERWIAPIAAGRVIDEQISDEEKHRLVNVVMSGLPT